MLSRKDTVPWFNSNNTGNDDGMYHQNNVPNAYDPSKYIGALIALDVISLLMIIFLSISAMKAYKFMASKDRILLFHFIFLELTIICNSFNIHNY